MGFFRDPVMMRERKTADRPTVHSLGEYIYIYIVVVVWYPNVTVDISLNYT